MWMIFAVLSAVFAALTSILAKIGIEGVNSNLATAIRTIVVVIMAWGMVFLTHAQNGLAEISKKSWIFLILSISQRLFQDIMQERLHAILQRKQALQ